MAVTMVMLMAMLMVMLIAMLMAVLVVTASVKIDLMSRLSSVDRARETRGDKQWLFSHNSLDPCLDPVRPSLTHLILFFIFPDELSIHLGSTPSLGLYLVEMSNSY